MKLTSCIKYLIFSALLFAPTVASAANHRAEINKHDFLLAVFDTVPIKKQPVPVTKSKKPNNAKTPKIKEVPKARPMPKPKVVGPKIKPGKIVRPKVGPKI